MIELKIKKLTPTATIPSYAHDGDMGLDIICNSVEYNPDKDEYICHTGLACETTNLTGVFAFCRSSIDNTEAYLSNHVGLIDSAIYRGEIQLRFKLRERIEDRAFKLAVLDWNSMPWYKKYKTTFSDVCCKWSVFCTNEAMSHAPYHKGDKIGQLVPVKLQKVTVKEVKELSDSNRGEGGFGSTGK